jgi:iron complex outermembrane recepter protein
MKMKEGLKFFIWVFVVLFLVSMGTAWAEEKSGSKDFEVYTLGEIVVRGEMQGVEDIGISTDVSAEDIKATNSHTVPEALAHVPGIQVTSGRKNEPEIAIHGFDQSQTLILIDGVPYYETANGKLDLNQFATDSIAKIEVIKGAHSVLYGPNAEAGVINIITKKPSDRPAISASYEIGELDADKFSFSHGMKVGILNYWLGYTHKESDAWKLSDDFKRRIGSIGYRTGGPPATVNTFLEDGGKSRNNSDYKTENFWAKVGIEPSSDSEYYVNFHYITTEKGDPPNLDSARVFRARPAFSFLDRMEKYDDWGIDLSGRQKVVDQLTLKGKFFYHKHKDDYVSYWDETYVTQIADSRYKDYVIGGMLFADYTPVEWDILKMAVHYKGDSHEERDDEYLPYAESFSYTGSVALENTFTYVNNLSIVAGASYDWFEVDRAETNITGGGGVFVRQDKLKTPDTQDDVNPMLGASYIFPDSTRIFGSVARKTRFPTLGQLYSGRSGNVDLKAEKSVNYTVGASRSFGDILKLELAPFHHDVSDRISRDAPGVAGIFQNYAKVKMTGLEFNAELTPIKDLLLKVGYTYNNARDKSKGAVTEKVTNAPKNIVNARIQYTIPHVGTRLDFNMVKVGKSYSQLPTPTNPNDPVLKSESYAFFGGKISQTFMKHFEAYLAVDNIFDKNYEPENGYPAAGRSFWLGLTVKY